ncbi:MAG: filamentous hemagglutinin N-terminal domain-containing protein, partial [Cyanobacteria bacterium J06632_3]
MNPTGDKVNAPSIKQNCQKLSLLLVPCIGGLYLPIGHASAQVIGADDSINTTVDVVGDRIDITGGQVSSEGDNLFHSFEQFDVEVEQTANFITPTDLQNVIGKITSDQASVIDGALQVSGSEANLYLMNPSGILMGPNAELNLSGGFTATTATDLGFEDGEFSIEDTSHTNALTGEVKTFHFSHSQPGAVVNLGDLAVEEGNAINLVGGTVVNAGSLSAPDGTVTLAAVEGENVVRIRQGEQLLSLEIEAQHSAIEEGTGITAQNISAMLTGGDAINGATALIQAADGTVRLVNSRESGESTPIAETGGHAIATGNISTAGETGGNINILSTQQVTLTGAHLDASGQYSGGLIRVGGDYQGQGDVLNTVRTEVDATSLLSVNALESGDGGRAIAWSDHTTRFHGQIEGMGGLLGGNGGFAEVSGKKKLTFTGLANLGASYGSIGDLLLDPDNIFITDGGTSHSIGGDDYIPSTTLETQVANINLSATN